MSEDNENPVTALAVVADPTKCPPGHRPLSKAYDDPSIEADIWKDGFFTFSCVYRYLCISKELPQNTEQIVVVADLSIINQGDLVPPGFVNVEQTIDTRERALRKKQLVIKVMPLDTAVDAVCDVIILAKAKRAPQGYSIAGDIDGLLVCFKYGTIPASFHQQAAARGGAPTSNAAGGLYPNANGPYPHHPNAVPNQYNNPVNGDVQRPGNQTLARQYSQVSGMEDVPFELSALLKAGLKNANNSSQNTFNIREITEQRLSAEFSYNFTVEQQCLENNLLSSPN